MPICPACGRDFKNFSKHYGGCISTQSGFSFEEIWEILVAEKEKRKTEKDSVSGGGGGEQDGGEQEQQPDEKAIKEEAQNEQDNEHIYEEAHVDGLGAAAGGVLTQIEPLAEPAAQQEKIAQLQTDCNSLHEQQVLLHESLSVLHAFKRAAGTKFESILSRLNALEANAAPLCAEYLEQADLFPEGVPSCPETPPIEPLDANIRPTEKRKRDASDELQ